MFAARQGFYSQPAAAPAGNVRRTGTAATLSTVTFTGRNGANFSTAQSLFGAGALDVVQNNKIIEAGSYSAVSTAGGWPNGTGDFCIEGWVWVPTARVNTKTGDPVCFNASNGLCVRFGQGYNSGGFNHLSIFARGQADLDRAPFTWPRQQWTHWAVQRKSAVISLWANGNKLARENGPSGTAATRSFSNGTSVVSMGSYNNGGSTDETMESWMDEVCVSNSWRYDDSQSDYVVPTAPFVVDEFTSMLIHFDDSLTTAAT